MNIGYIRVSTVDQNDSRQFESLKSYNIEKYYTDKTSGKDMERPGLKDLLDFVREGDVIYIHDFSRIARKTIDLLNLITLLGKKGVRLISIKESFDTGTPLGKAMITIISALNEFERENLLERQREGIAIAKQKGQYKGRKAIKKPSNWDQVYSAWKNRELSGLEAMDLLGIKKNTFYRFVNEEKELNSER